MSSEQRIVVTGRVDAAPGKAALLRQALLDIVMPTRADPGNLGYELHEALDQPGRFLLIEHWRDDASLASHKAGNAYKAFFARVQTERLLADAEELHWRKIDK